VGFFCSKLIADISKFRPLIIIELGDNINFDVVVQLYLDSASRQELLEAFYKSILVQAEALYAEWPVIEYAEFERS